MANKIQFQLVSLCFALSLLFAYACNTEKTKNKIVTQLDEYLTSQTKYFRFNGNVLVAENGGIIFQKSYGYAHFDTKHMLNDSSVFDLASVSKQFTATAVLLLKDKGKLSLTDSLRQYFPELQYSSITIYQMLTHTSGLPDYEEAMKNKWNHNIIAFNNDMIAFLAKENPPALFRPSTKWQYSNTAYALLASIVEKVSRQTFSEFMTQNIFQPLQMNHTRIYNTRRSSKDTIANNAYGFVYNGRLKKYLLPDSVAELKFVYYLDGIQGDGVVNSTTTDLLKWDRAVKNHTLLSEVSQNEMLKEQVLTVRGNSYYGFGVFLEKTELGYTVSHSGGWPGYITNLSRNIDKDQTFIVLSNNYSLSPSISNALQHILNGKPIVMPYHHKEISIDSVNLQKFIGKYKGTSEISFERSRDKLFMVSQNGRKIELKPESTTKFFYANGIDQQIEFVMDTNNNIAKLWLINFGVKTEFQKMK